MHRLLQHWLTEQADKWPDSAAIVLGDRKLTYGMLDTQSNRLASLLKDRNCQKGDRIGIYMPKSAESIISLFGIFKADAIFVPLDVDEPVSRTQKILRKSGVSWLLTADKMEQSVIELLSDEELKKCISMGWMSWDPPDLSLKDYLAFQINELREYADYQPKYKNRPEDPSYILFNSASTGELNGVINTHANVIHYVEWGVRYFDINSDDRLSGHLPLHFGLSGLDIHAAISTGAELHLAPRAIDIFPTLIGNFIRDQKLTQWFSVPSVLTLMANLDIVHENDFPELKRIFCCGEALPASCLSYLMKKLPHVRYTNLYDPAETTIAGSSIMIPDYPENKEIDIPIETEFDGEQLHVLDKNFSPVENGHTGRLNILEKVAVKGY